MLRIALLVTAITGFLFACAPQPTTAAPMGSLAPLTMSISLPDIFGLDLDDILKVGGVVVIVDQFGEEINDFINSVLDNEDARTGSATKVVVIVTPTGKYLGAAQVTGPRAAVDKVKAVAQLEQEFRPGIRIRALIPIANERATNITRVQGVAVSAMVDLKI